MAVPPFDRALALACRLEAFRANWIEVECCRGLWQLPVRMVLAADPRRDGGTLADFVITLRCQACARGQVVPCCAIAWPAKLRHGPAMGRHWLGGWNC